MTSTVWVVRLNMRRSNIMLELEQYKPGLSQLEEAIKEIEVSL
jgi:hypothetical protein